MEESFIKSSLQKLKVVSTNNDSSTQTEQCDNWNIINATEINIICRKCLKEINYSNIISHDKRCVQNTKSCGKCNLKIDVNRLERHNLIECKFSDYYRRIEINCPICLDNLAEIPEKHRKITPCGHFICLECAKRNITVRTCSMREIIANFTYYHDVSIPESRCPRCRKDFEIESLRTLYL